MNTRRGSQYCIQSDGVGLRSRIEPSKGKRKEKSPVEQNLHKEVPEMPIISGPDWQQSMSNFNRYKSHSEGTDRHIHGPVQTVIYYVQGQGLGNAGTNPPRSDELLEHSDKVPQRGGNSEILQWMKSTIIQTSDQKDEAITCQKEGGKQARSTSSFYQ
ncbi:hypothetical protein O181_078064 [Austropuccinia psidii MF-1]|uniref:Uncharacterized protein n=1 Tax=Austropuccinia psidii MF-1 TaxID=1389203 RepID=A0A9Q3FFS3_9BASI|nr:hypothetical protein [Austropuccinia psidii MF-1]